MRASSGRVSGSITSSSYRANTMTCAILLMLTCHTAPGTKGNRFKDPEPSGLLPHAESAA
ncbi:hypothetical protein GCM10017557_82350 [Streptomyces aurantiacus]|uniref:Uncharacterized protein n=1 Tax=Streptomyces aurantiacus TaxID=47760 RepID=A0A7G1PH93_9ACTN|nr:hypothetical protein GCM10017557_82350 [Streptomyces aurantiacus]